MRITMNQGFGINGRRICNYVEIYSTMVRLSEPMRLLTHDRVIAGYSDTVILV